MFEQVQEIAANPFVLPLALGAVGYGIGQLGEQRAINIIAKNRSEFLPAQNNVAENYITKQSRLKRGLAHLALLGAATGFALGIVATPSQPHKTASTALEMVVDHSFQTGADGSVANINKVAKSFSSVGGIETKTIVAHNGTSDKIVNAQIAKDKPYGPPSMSEAIQSAEANGSNSAILVVADGYVGSPNGVVSKSHENGDIPVFVINTSTNDAGKTALQQISTQTGGQYWSANVSKDSVASSIKSKMVTTQETSKSNGYNKDPLYILAAGLLVITGLRYRNRKLETTVS